ncbi:hypothetical protein CLOM621_08597 [Clostridium sp. M62/1]|nr:hypothetical protein CLOM621_08597 [Clostridium sp. M62/1]
MIFYKIYTSLLHMFIQCLCERKVGPFSVAPLLSFLYNLYHL